MKYRIGADTNVLFSGFYFSGPPEEVVRKILRNECVLFTSEYLAEELKEVAMRKRTDMETVRKFLELSNVRVLPDEEYDNMESSEEAEKLVRDAKDRPVFAFASHTLKHGIIDYFLSGDNDLLEEKVRKALKGRLISAREFLELT